MEVSLDTCGRLDVRSLLLLMLHLFLVGAAADCPKPEGGENIVITDAALLLNYFPDQFEVSLECANGYIKESGSGNIRCIDGHWSKPDLICKKKDCGPPEPQPHMTFQPADQTLFGATIQVICDKGYEVDGANFRQCYATGWSGRSRCELVECEKPDNVTNGINSWISEDYPTYGQAVKYQCNDGYTLIGNDTIMCDETGGYNHPPPRCIVVECEKPDNVTNGINSWKSEDYPTYGQAVKYQCNDGYILIGNDTIMCDETGDYNHPPPKCIALALGP